MRKLEFLALSGSLRADSYNTAALEALRDLAPDDVEIHIGDIGSLPLFNPDLEQARIPEVEKLKYDLSQSDGLILASPEYAHGISGVMKNALDWLVSGSEFPDKKVMLINTSPRATRAENALREVIVTMSGVMAEAANVSIPLLGSNLNKPGIMENPELSATLEKGLLNLRASIKELEPE